MDVFYGHSKYGKIHITPDQSWYVRLLFRVLWIIIICTIIVCVGAWNKKSWCIHTWTWSWHRLVLFDGKMVLKILNFTQSNPENIKEWFTTRTSGWSLRTAVCYKQNFCIIRDYYWEHTLLVLPCGLGNLPICHLVYCLVLWLLIFLAPIDLCWVQQPVLISCFINDKEWQTKLSKSGPTGNNNNKKKHQL